MQHAVNSSSDSARAAAVAGPVLLFDADCRLCRSTVDFILRHEVAHSPLRFCPLQSPMARRLLRLNGEEPTPLESVFLVEPGGLVLARSDATVRVASFLPWPWRWARIAKILPRRVRDVFYDWIARNRLRWCGRPRETIETVIDRHRDRFLP